MKPLLYISLIVCLCFQLHQVHGQCDNKDFIRLHKEGKAEYNAGKYTSALDKLRHAIGICPDCTECATLIDNCQKKIKMLARQKEEAAQRKKEEQDKLEAAQREKKEQERLEAVRREKEKQERQDAIAKQKALKKNIGGFDFILVEGGTYLMGSNQGDADAQAYEMVNGYKHSVAISSFYMGKYEVTQAQWKAVMGANPKELHNTDCDQCPVESVNWNDVQEFLKKLNAQKGYTMATGYRLPTEEEWEYAARGGTHWVDDYTYAGSNVIGNVAWYDGNYKDSRHGSEGTTHPVGTKAPNQLGIYDMSGNVWEWCQDWSKGYPGSTGVSDNTNASRVIRGGSWYFISQYCRVALRLTGYPTSRNYNIGFRLAFPQ